MKRLVTSELGLHPLTLQDFDFMQKTYLEGIRESVRALVGDTPCILHGIYASMSGAIGLPPFQIYEHIFTGGAYWDGSEILLFYGQTLFTNQPFLTQFYTNVGFNDQVFPPVVYKNGISKNIYTERYLYLSHTPNPTDPYSISIFDIPRADAVIANRIGLTNALVEINTIKNQISTLQNQLSNHVNTGGHDWSRIANKPIIDVGIFPYTDLNTNDYSFTVLGKSFGTTNYAVLVSHEYKGNINNASNDMGFSIVNQTASGFTIMMSDPLNSGGHLPAGNIRYVVYKL
jgi:hypothetical protein